MIKNSFRYHSGNWLSEDMTIVRKRLTYNIDIHMHSFYEIEVITGGCGTLTFNGQSCELSAGTLMLLTPIDSHSISTDGYLDIINISFNEAAISANLQNIFVNPTENVIMKLESHDMEKFLMYAELFENELKKHDQFSENEQKNILNTILVSIARGMNSENKISACSDVARIQSSIRYLLTNFTENVTLCEVAAQSGYSTNYFSKIFFEFTGKKYIDFLNSLRVSYAKMLLCTTESNIIEIALSSGFSTLSNFSRVFKNIVGITPAAYRKENKKR